MKGYIKLPRTLFESGAWKDANAGQKVFIVELYSRVAYSRHEQKLKKGTVTVEAGQLAISLREFASELGVPVRTLRDMIAYFSKKGIVNASAQETEIFDAHSKIKYTLLTINNIECAVESGSRTAESENHRTYTEENNYNNLFGNKLPHTNARGQKFVKPTADEVQCELDNRGIKFFTGIDFCSYYESCGWTVGKNKPMKSWKACINTWLKHEYKTPSNYGNKNTYHPTDRQAEAAQRRQEFEQYIRQKLSGNQNREQETLPF